MGKEVMNSEVVFKQVVAGDTPSKICILRGDGLVQYVSPDQLGLAISDGGIEVSQVAGLQALLNRFVTLDTAQAITADKIFEDLTARTLDVTDGLNVGGNLFVGDNKIVVVDDNMDINTNLRLGSKAFWVNGIQAADDSHAASLGVEVGQMYIKSATGSIQVRLSNGR